MVSLNKALFIGGGSFGGGTLDSHESYRMRLKKKVGIHQGKSTWHIPCIGLYKPYTNLPFGVCAMYFYHQVTCFY